MGRKKAERVSPCIKICALKICIAPHCSPQAPPYSSTYRNFTAAAAARRGPTRPRRPCAGNNGTPHSGRAPCGMSPYSDGGFLCRSSRMRCTAASSGRRAARARRSQRRSLSARSRGLAPPLEGPAARAPSPTSSKIHRDREGPGQTPRPGQSLGSGAGGAGEGRRRRCSRRTAAAADAAPCPTAADAVTALPLLWSLGLLFLFCVAGFSQLRSIAKHSTQKRQSSSRAAYGGSRRAVRRGSATVCRSAI